MVTLPAAVAARYERLSGFNSPYPAHDRGAAVDLYPPGTGHEPGPAPSPVAGTVVESRTVRCPDRAYAAARDHLLAIRLADPAAWDAPAGAVARILHVDPAVTPGDDVTVGDALGRTVRSGFFGRWVGNHLHVGIRPPGADVVRASGSVPLDLGVEVTPVAWDGTGTVVETGPAHVRLDAPAHPDPARTTTREFGGVAAVGAGAGAGANSGAGAGAGADASVDPAPAGDLDPSRGSFAALASDEGAPLDGGLVHYEGGGALDVAADATGRGTRTLSLLGTPVGVADGRTVSWRPVAIRANGERVAGLSLFAARVQFGTKLVAPGHGFAVGDDVAVTVEPVAEDEATRFG